MEVQCALHGRFSAPKFSPFQYHCASPSSSLGKHSKSLVRLRKQPLFLRLELKLNSWMRNGETAYLSSSSSSKKLRSSEREDNNVPAQDIRGLEPFRGKSGSISFVGLTDQSVEESNSESAPFEEKDGSFLWVVAPFALILSFVLPRFLIDIAIDGIKNEVFSEFVSSSITEVIFYIGVGVFLSITGHVQKPYLEFSAKRWSLITGLWGYSTSTFIVMGFKALVPLVALYVTWPVLDTTALVAMAPFLVGCLAQFAFERHLEKSRSSCWPLVPIIFEVYRFYQLTRAISFVQKVMFAARKLPITMESVQRNGAFVSLIVTFQVLGLMGLWSLLSFLLRLFPSRPVAENY